MLSRLATVLLSAGLLLGCSISGDAATTAKDNRSGTTSYLLEDAQRHQLDLIVLVKTTPFERSFGDYRPAAFRLNIDGELVLVGDEDARDSIYYNNCFLSDLEAHEGTRAVFAAMEAGEEWLTRVNTFYQANGIDQPAVVAAGFLEDYFSAAGREMRLHRFCVDDQRYRTPAVQASNPHVVEVIIAPRYLHAIIANGWPFTDSGARFHTLKEIPFAELQHRAQALAAQNAEAEQEALTLGRRYARLAEQASKEFVGALLLGLNTRDKGFAADDRFRQGEGFYRQNSCSQGYQDADAASILGYRRLGEEMLTGGLTTYFETFARSTGSPVRFAAEEEAAAFERTFASLDDAYAHFSDYRRQPGFTVDGSACHLFVDFPENLWTLNRALARDGIETYFLRLLAVEPLRDGYAEDRGFTSYAELDFMQRLPGSVTWDQVEALRERGLNEEIAYRKLVAEIEDTGYPGEEPLSVARMLDYLGDRDRAEAEGLTVAQAQQSRLEDDREERRRLAERQQQQRDALAERFPYQAILACEFQGRHTTIAACFQGGRHGVDTALEVRNGDEYTMYPVYQLAAAGRESRDGLILDLQETFQITAQNSSSSLLLTLTIRERASGRTVYQRSVQHYGVVSASR